MSVVVALKFSDGVVIGADRQVTQYGEYASKTSKLKYFKDSNIAIGLSGYVSDFCPIYYCNEIVDYKDIHGQATIDGKYTYDNIVPSLIKLMDTHNCIENINGVKKCKSTFLLATKDEIMIILNNFGIMVVGDEFASIGCGLDAANGYLNVIMENKNRKDIDESSAKQIVEKAIKEACKDNCFVGMGVDMYVIKNKEENKN